MIGPTLGRYLSLRFTKTILAVFGTIFLLIYLIDFVEMLRRSGDIPGVTTAYVALLTLMRVPSVSEQVLPFATLGGAMVAFLGLTRKLELVVARAAGVSVWQFLAPPVMIVLLLGIFSITVYNPVSAHLKQRADLIETKWFGQAGRSGSDPGLWIRQRSVDGQAIIRAEQSSAKGTQLGSVTAFVYDLDGRFKERIEAATATLAPGFWTLDDARIFTADHEPRPNPHYLLSTNLTPEQVTQSFVSPDAVPFWSLLDLSRRTEAAGLDATAYRLRFQALLARPLLLVAMVLIAAAFSLRFFRFGGISKMVSGGVGAGFVLYVATKVVSDLGGAGLLSAPVAAWSPALVGSMLGALVLLHQEDG